MNIENVEPSYRMEEENQAQWLVPVHSSWEDW